MESVSRLGAPIVNQHAPEAKTGEALGWSAVFVALPAIRSYMQKRRGAVSGLSRKEGVMRGWMVVVLAVVVAGCVTPIKESSGLFVKPVATEVRSPFGTNTVYTRLQRCHGPERSVLFYLEADFTDCVNLPMEEQVAYSFGYSQGQGGQIVEGAMNAGALSGLAAVKSGGHAVTSASAVAIQSTSVAVPRGRHH